MYLSSVEITGYKLFCAPFAVGFEPGLTVLVGENGAGKSAVIDAVRLLLVEDEYGRAGISWSDFHRPLGRPARDRGVDQLVISGVFAGLDEPTQAAYLPWLELAAPERARLTLRVENREDSSTSGGAARRQEVSSNGSCYRQLAASIYLRCEMPKVSSVPTEVPASPG